MANIDIDSIEKKVENLDLVFGLLKEGQNEIKRLRYNNRIQAVKLYRAKQKVKNLSSLIENVKQRKYLSEKACEVLEVS